MIATCPLCGGETEVHGPGEQACTVCGGPIDVEIDLLDPPDRPDATPSDRCVQHPTADAPHRCAECGAAVCDTCRLDIHDEVACPACFEEGRVDLGRVLPWLERDRLGFLRAFWETLKALVVHPARSAGRLAASSRLGPSIGFAALCGLTYGLVGTLMSLLCLTPQLFLGVAGGLGRASLAEPLLMAGITVGCNVFVTPVMAAVGPFLGALVFHPVTVLLGGRGSFSRTVECLAYTQVQLVLYIAPCVGPLVALVYSVLLPFQFFREAHDLSTERALIVAFTPWILCCLMTSAGVGVVVLVVTYA